MNGVLIVDKPAGLTSHDVVNRVRRILRERSVGHLGTLDPIATGVLPLVVGNLTRLAQFYTASEKTYEGVIRFGFSTDTYDADGNATSAVQETVLTLAGLRQISRRFTGTIEQMPPPFSAKKIKGVPAYKLARRKQEVPLQAVQVEIKEFEILKVDGDRASFRIRVASGTYVRSIAHEMGTALGCGAHLTELRRTHVSEFELLDAHTLEELQFAADVTSEQIEDLFVHPRKLLPEFPAVTANDDMLASIRFGRAVNLPDVSNARRVRVFRGQRELVAIATRIAGTLFHPGLVFLQNTTEKTI